MMFRSGTDRLENRTVARPREVRSAASRDWPQRRRRALRLVVESLEDRTVLTTLLTVSSLLDDGTAGTLRAVIGQANSGNDNEYVIRFDPTVTGTITLTQGELALANSNAAVAAKAITIEGPGATQLAVSGNNASRVFEIMSGLTATLEGLTITRGQAAFGGGIHNNRGTLTVSDSTISDNFASNGGGIANYSGTVTVTNSTLSSNSTTNYGGGIYNYSFDSTVTVTNSIISDNSAYFGGGIYNNNYGTATVSDSTLSGNSAVNSGGGLYNSDGWLTVTDSTLSGNSADEGGGLFNNFGTSTVANSTLSGNSAVNTGGGIQNNIGGELTVTNSTLSGNIANTSGGGIFNGNGGRMTVAASTFSGNSGGIGGGGIFNGYGVLTVTNSILSGNIANTSGGGIFNDSLGTLTVTNSTLSGNSADSGGGIYNKRHDNTGVLTVTNTTLSDNSATNSGGGIFNDNGGRLRVTSSTLSGNTAGNTGGGIHNDIDGTLKVTNSTLSGNSATNSGGGGIYSNDGTVMVTDSVLSDNSANSGGGISNSNGTLTITGSTLSGNSGGLGGGISNGGELTVTTSTLRGNSAIEFGGGIFNGGELAVIASTLSGNSAGNTGGGIYNTGGQVKILTSTLSGNSASSDGGGIYSDGTLTVTASTLSGNSATYNGGGIARFRGGPVTLTNSIVAGNQGPSGPDLYGVVSSQGHNLIGNTADSSGWASTDLTGSVAFPLAPLLGPLQDNGGPTQTMALLPGSPALNAGAAVPGLTTDQRGVARPQGSAFDIGAFESRGFVLTIVSGGVQSTVVGQSFGQPLVVSVSSPFGEPVDGGVVRFTAPGNGPSTASTTGSATIAQGKASLSAVANTQAGSYVVIASTLGVSQPGSFRLTNTPGIPTQVTAISGTPQTAMVTTTFAQPLVVRVTDPYGNPVPGVTVTFTAAGTGPGASFGEATTFTTTTDAGGLATAQATANTETGQYVVTAAVAGLTPPVGFALTNSPPIVPSVVGLQRLGFHRQPTRLILNFSAELDPSRAIAPQNYALLHAGRDGLLGTRDDRIIGLTRVVYDPAGPIVTLRPNRRLSLKRRYTLVVRGTPPDGLASPSGGFLAGDGQPGTDYVTTFGREILIRPQQVKSSGSPAGPKAGSMSMVGRSRPSHHG